MGIAKINYTNPEQIPSELTCTLCNHIFLQRATGLPPTSTQRRFVVECPECKASPEVLTGNEDPEMICVSSFRHARFVEAGPLKVTGDHVASASSSSTTLSTPSSAVTLTSPRSELPRPYLVFMIFQCMFAAFTPALTIGAAAERGRIVPTLAFIFLWITFIYDFIACWT
ncbi:MAG: hypothetical protein J3R72DRAFT_498484 [Linnemannia gamsii]|nr:MAG: hypothetical protein J3R72DRAFT_498484 [Linnemannia gamsii]